MDEKNWCVYCGTFLGPWPLDQNSTPHWTKVQCPKCGNITHWDSGRNIPPYAEGGRPLRCPNCEYVHGLDIAGNLWGPNPPLPCPQCGFDLRSQFTSKQPWKTATSSRSGQQNDANRVSTFPRTQPDTSYPNKAQPPSTSTLPSMPPGIQTQGTRTGQAIPPSQTSQGTTQSQPRRKPSPAPAPDWPQPSNQGMGKTGAWILSILLTVISLFGGFYLGSVAMSEIGLTLLPGLGGMPSLAGTLIAILLAVCFVAISLGFIIPAIWKKVSWRYGGQGCSKVIVWLIRIILFIAIIVLCLLSVAIIDDPATLRRSGVDKAPYAFHIFENIVNPTQYKLEQKASTSPPPISNEPSQDFPGQLETSIPPEEAGHVLSPPTHFPLVLVNQTTRDICFLKLSSWESNHPSLSENILELAHIMFPQGDTIEILLMYTGDTSDDFDQYYVTISGTTDFQTGVKLLDARYNPRTVDVWVHACGVFSKWERQYFSIEIPNQKFVLSN